MIHLASLYIRMYRWTLWVLLFKNIYSKHGKDIPHLSFAEITLWIEHQNVVLGIKEKLFYIVNPRSHSETNIQYIIVVIPKKKLLSYIYTHTLSKTHGSLPFLQEKFNDCKKIIKTKNLELIFKEIRTEPRKCIFVYISVKKKLIPVRSSSR